jgi:hypothetical protein
MAEKRPKRFLAEELLCQDITKEEIWQKAKEVGFIKRVRKVNPVGFLLSLIFSLDQADGQSLAQILRHLLLTGVIHLVRSSFWDRMNTSLDHLMRWVITRLQVASEFHSPRLKGTLKGFTDVIALDCTILTLPDTLATVWPATRQNIASAVKVFTQIRVLTGELLKSHIVPERTPDHRFCHVLRWRPGCLYLFDLGFVSGYVWQCIEKANAYFVSRMHSSTQPIITQCYAGSVSRRYRGKRLKDIAHHYAHHTMDVQCSFAVRRPMSDTIIGQVSCRVIGIWNPRTKQHHFYVTNISWLEGHLFAQLYRLRWEVELFYKLGKSGLGLGRIKTKQPHIIRILIRAALIRSTLALKAKIIAEGYLPLGCWINPLAWVKIIRHFLCPSLVSLLYFSSNIACSWQALAFLAIDPNKHRMPLRVKFAMGCFVVEKNA